MDKNIMPEVEISLKSSEEIPARCIITGEKVINYRIPYLTISAKNELASTQMDSEVGEEFLDFTRLEFLTFLMKNLPVCDDFKEIYRTMFDQNIKINELVEALATEMRAVISDSHNAKLNE